jgi:uncharacterized protein (TIGR00106 family)
MIAEISVFPLDKGGAGLSKYVADSFKIIRDSGLDYELNAMGTVVEGPSDAVFDLIRKLHRDMAAKCDRVIMDVKIDDRRNAEKRMKRKVQSVLDKAGG